MWSPTVRQRCWKVPVDPVKWIPAKSGCDSATRDNAWPCPVTRLITPGGRPAASRSRMMKCAENCWVVAGFHTTVLPIRAGAVGRLPAIEVKLNGVIARTKPSSGRWSRRFHTPGPEIGCSARICRAKWGLNRQKSINSQAASISAWNGDLDCPRTVEPFSVARHGPERRSAAFRKKAARASNDSDPQVGGASRAALMAARTPSSGAFPRVPRTACRLCVWTTSICSPPPSRWAPPIVIVSSTRSAVSSLIRPPGGSRSWLPGAYDLTGSLTGLGTTVTASMLASAPRSSTLMGVRHASSHGRGGTATARRTAWRSVEAKRRRWGRSGPAGSAAGWLRSHATEEIRDLLGGIPEQFVILAAVEQELGVPVPGVGIRYGAERGANVVDGVVAVDMDRGEAVDRRGDGHSDDRPRPLVDRAGQRDQTGGRNIRGDDQPDRRAPGSYGQLA